MGGYGNGAGSEFEKIKKWASVGLRSIDNLEMQQSKKKVSTGSVYLLWHTDPYGDEKLIGVYTTRSGASSAES